MRRLLFFAALLVMALCLLPGLRPQENAAVPEEDASALPDAQTVTVSIDGTPTELPLESYVEGVVSAEIPADFPREALRAQAVAARTYALCKLSRGRPDAHPDADLCDDYRHCAAYRSPAASVFASGEQSAVRAAVQDTEGEILTSEGAPIAAVFHCVSGPRTESAADVWGEDVPYLQSVVSPAEPRSTATKARSRFPPTNSAKEQAARTPTPISPVRPTRGSGRPSARPPAASKPCGSAV